MKLRKQSILPAAFLLAVLLLTSCKSKDDSVSIHPDADVSSSPAAVSASLPAPAQSHADSSGLAESGGSGFTSTTDPSLPPVSSIPPQEEDLQSVTGIIDDTAMGTYYVELEDGRIVGFYRGGADTSALTDTMPGSPITVYYYGRLEDNNTEGITVVKMETPA